MVQKKRLLLIDPYIGWEEKAPPLAYLRRVAERQGGKAFVFRPASPTRAVEETLKTIESITPDSVGINVLMGPCLRVATDITEGIKKWWPRLPVVWGGQALLVLPSGCLQLSPADALIVGRGEEAIKKMIDNPESYLGKKKVYNDVSSVENKNDLPFMYLDTDVDEYAHFHLDNANGGVRKTICWSSSTGCDGGCSFCFHKGSGKYRPLGPERLCKELEHYYNRHSVTGFEFTDDNFVADQERIFFMCRRFMKDKLDVHWLCEMRVDQVNRELIDVMYKAGLRRIFLGLESGAESMLEKLGKGYGRKDILQCFEILSDYCDIEVIVPVLLNVPGQTQAEVETTTNLLRKVRPHRIDPVFLVPYPGTKLFSDCLASGFIPPDQLRTWADIASYETFEFNLTRDISDADLLDYRVVLRHRSSKKTAIGPRAKTPSGDGFLIS